MTHRFAIIGAGMIGRWHAEAIRQLDGAALVAVCDHGSGRGGEIGPRCDCPGSCEPERLLDRSDVDIVVLATPSGSHGELAVMAAEHGKHCLVEKPVEITLEAIDRMIAAHERAGTLLGGIFNQRFSPAARALRAAVDAGRFGRPTFGMAHCPWWRDQEYYDSGGWRGTWNQDGGGALMNQGIHSIDLLQWLMGPVRRVTALTATLAHQRIEVEDTGAAALEFESGALGSISCTTSVWPGHFRTVEIAGTDGTASLADENFLVWRFRQEDPEDDAIRKRHEYLAGVSTGAANPSAGFSADGHRENFRAFLDALNEGKRPDIDGAEARKAVEIVLAIYRSARNGGSTVTLPLG